LVALSHAVAPAEKELAASGPDRLAVVFARFIVRHVAVPPVSLLDIVAAMDKRDRFTLS
jgi:hypothetical protein